MNQIEFDENGKPIIPKSQNETEDEELESGEYKEIPKVERRVITEKTDPTIRDICERLDKKKMISNPDFQRSYVWDNKPIIKSRKGLDQR